MDNKQTEKRLQRAQSKVWKANKKIRHYHSSLIPRKRSEWFMTKLENLEFSSVLEIGSCTGRNLSYILDKFPEVKASGIDVNLRAINFAKKKIPAADFEKIDIYNMGTDKKWDLVFTMAVLIHIHPCGIRSVIEKCIKVANKYIIHIERNGDNSVLNGPKELNPVRVNKRLHWQPDIFGMYKELGFNPVVIDVPDEFKHAGTSHFVFVEM